MRKSEQVGLLITRIFLSVLPVAGLVLCPVHVAALLKMEDEICGFVMFLTVLTALVVLFESFRMMDEEAGPGRKIVCMASIVAEIALLSILAWQYRFAIIGQATLNEPEKVVYALTLTLSLLVGYSLALLNLGFVFVKELRG